MFLMLILLISQKFSGYVTDGRTDGAHLNRVYLGHYHNIFVIFVANDLMFDCVIDLLFGSYHDWVVKKTSFE